MNVYKIIMSATYHRLFSPENVVPESVACDAAKQHLPAEPRATARNGRPPTRHGVVRHNDGTAGQ